jgi:hypothetical protein
MEAAEFVIEMEDTDKGHHSQDQDGEGEINNF